MEKGLNAIEIKDVEAGLQLKTSDLAIEGEYARFPLAIDTKNWSFGKRKGLTTRYGIMPFPGHGSSQNQFMATITLDGTAGYYPINMLSAEGDRATHPKQKKSYRNSYDVYEKRTACLGAFIAGQVVQPNANTAKIKYPVLYWSNLRTKQPDTLAATIEYDLCPSWESYTVQGVVSQYEETIGGSTAIIPAPQTLADSTEDDRVDFGISLPRLLTNDIVKLRRIQNTAWFARAAEHKYSVNYSFNDFVAGVISPFAFIAATKPADCYFQCYGTFPGIWDLSQKRSLQVEVHAFGYGDAAPAFTNEVRIWSGTFDFTTVIEKTDEVVSVQGYLRGLGTVGSNINENSGKITWGPGTTNTLNWSVMSTKTSFAVTPPTTDKLYCKTNAIPVAINNSVLAQVIDGKAIISLYNEYYQDKLEPSNAHVTPNLYSNDKMLWASPCEQVYSPSNLDTIWIGGVRYSESFDNVNFTTIKTCWASAPPYNAGVTTPTATIIVADKGVLLSNVSYEYTYSIYNAITGIESNVGAPAKAYTGATFNAAIRVKTSAFPLTPNSLLPTLEQLSYIFPNADMSAGPVLPTINSGLPINYLSYRFYYREVGSYEWLFADERSFARIYFKPYDDDIFLGASDAVGLPGGQPGGYIDNSPLPSDTYLDVLSFAKKLWWVSKDAVRFSTENAFCYPVRNYISASSGEFRGGIVHYFAGQAEARGRLVIFGSKGMYDIRETTEFQTTQIRVSASSDPLSVPIPDSNISVAERSSHTAFSGRTAVVAENGLYFWGPSGIFRDDGVNLPTRISDPIEPNLFDTYDKTKTAEFFAYYNKKSQEILFFYRPSDTTSGELTKAWVYSMRVEDWPNGILGAWSQYTYKCLIDWAQEIDLTNFYGGIVGGTVEAPRGAGLRTLIGVREAANSTVSRPFLHDDLCECGDMTSGKQMMVSSISRTNPTTVRFNFTSDSTIVPLVVEAQLGQNVYIYGSQEYGQLPTNFDGMRVVTKSDTGYIEVTDTTGYPVIGVPKTLTMKSYFPIFFAEHDIPCNIDTNFFAPYGLGSWLRYRYMHLLTQPTLKYTGTVNPSCIISWNCNHTIADVTSKTITLNAQNTRESTTQIIFDMASPGMQSEGQGIELRVAYNQRGPRWTIYSWNLWAAPADGIRNLLTYQQ